MGIEIVSGFCSHSRQVELRFGVEEHMRLHWCPHCGAMTITSPIIAEKIAAHLQGEGAIGLFIEATLGGAMRFHPKGGELARVVPGGISG